MEGKKKDISNINIKEVKTLCEAGKIDELLAKVKQVKNSVSDMSRKLGEKQQALAKSRQAEETAKTENESASVNTASSTSQSDSKETAGEVAFEKKQVAHKSNDNLSDGKVNRAEETKSNDNTTVKAQDVSQQKTDKKAEEKQTVKAEAKVEAKTEQKSEAKPQAKVEAKTETKVEVKGETKSEVKVEAKTEVKSEVKAETATAETKPASPYPTIVRPKYVAPERKQMTVQRGERREYSPDNRNNNGQRREYVPRTDDRRPQNGQRPYNNNGQRPEGGYQQRNNYGQRPQYGQNNNRPQGQGQNGAQSRPYTPRPQKPVEVAFIPKDTSKTFGAKKKQGEKNYDDKHTISKKQLIKSEISVEDFDENKTGYRKLRTKKVAKTKEEQRIKIEKAVVNKELIPVKELSEKIGTTAVEITKILFKEGIIKTINDSVDFDTAEFIAAGLGIELELKLDKTAEDVLSEGFNEDTDDEKDYVKRPPIVTVMGHVDHGKTSLLDKIRSANVTAGEAGGITQHIGAYSVSVKGNKITFLDTPGHAAFTAMRARGAQVTDIAVIVIAADDGIMPQTIEAINHAKAANVSIIIAANKMDKPHANIEKVRQQLSEQGILVEEWGGDVVLVPVSAKTGEGVDLLLDSILLVAEMRELKANPKRKAKGVVVEAKLDKGKGPVATIIVQNGTLRSGDNIVAGMIVGKVRAMFDDKGRMVKEAGPSMAVSVLGLETVPNAGDLLFAVDQEKLTKLVAEERKNKEREDMIRQQQKVSLDELFSKISDGDLKHLNIIIKADVQGSVEAVKQSLEQLSSELVKVSVIHAAVGAISETDVMLADSSNSIIIGFNVRPDANAKTLAERSKIDIRLYRIIYEAIEDVQKAMKGLLAPKFNDVYMGKAEVRDTFKITGVGMVAGCYVTEGKIVRSGKLRIYRENVMICEGNVLQLKRFKDDVKEVAQGYECGISIENFNDIKVGDYIESYITEQQKD